MILYFRLKQCNVIAKEDHHFTSNFFRKKMLAGQTCPGAVFASELNTHTDRVATEIKTTAPESVFPNRGDFKASFNAVPVPYVTATWERP